MEFCWLKPCDPWARFQVGINFSDAKYLVFKSKFKEAEQMPSKVQ